MAQLKSMNISRAAEDASRVLMFDHWIRFYFVVEEDGKLFIRVPQEQADEVKESHPEFFSYLDMVNEDELTFEKSQATVCAFIGARLDGSKYDESIMPRMFDSKEFKMEQYVFNLWLKGHEKHLDEKYHSFAEWEEMFTEWLKLDEVTAYLKRLKESVPQEMDPESETLH